MARFWNKYPYTDFHELNIGWCVDKITDFEARITSVEEDVAALKVRATALEARMSTAENKLTQHTSQIGALETSSASHETRIQALENADIQDAAMLESVSSVSTSENAVTVNFSAAAYADGAKTAGTDEAVIPAATSSKAGVMVPDDKNKLTKFTFNGNDLQLPGDLSVNGDIVAAEGSFSGPVSAGSPVAAGDLATKAYVDSMAISGSATVDTAVAEGSVHWREGSSNVEYDQFSVKTYGKVAQIRSWIAHTLTSNHLKDTTLFNVHIPEQYKGSLYENLILWDNTAAAPIPCRLQGWSSDGAGSGTVGAEIIPMINVTSGHELEVYFGSVYLITV